MGIFTLLIVLLIAGCAPSTDSDAPERATVAVMSEVPPGMPLDQILTLLEEHLVRAEVGRMEGSALDEFRHAEAITDRLLEARAPFTWLSAEDYSVQSRLRQVQSMADRVHAQVRTGMPRDTVLRNLGELRDQVRQLRRALAQGGTVAPPGIEELLSGDSSSVPRSAITTTPDAPRPAGAAPLGTALPPPDTTTTSDSGPPAP